MGEKPVLGVVWMGRGAVSLIGLAQQDQAVKRLHGPAVGDELMGQEIEQLRMGWSFPGLAEVVNGANEALAEVVLPETDVKKEKALTSIIQFTTVLAQIGSVLATLAILNR